ncbi:unnamed protein product [Dovyalis caffra]|uniref:Uncharacterized protein n=1 Tax=Dovyalis caffra TaxID=77055 RepID=A0AAV1QRK6_9ROSI|nr:unnamed protein product [Dovyalis caffra]
MRVGFKEGQEMEKRERRWEGEENGDELERIRDLHVLEEDLKLVDLFVLWVVLIRLWCRRDCGGERNREGNR